MQLSLISLTLAALRSPSNASLNLSFVGVNTLDPQVTFTRASIATQFDSTGALVYAPHNLMTFSEQFDNAAWTKFGTTSVVANAAVAPDGTLTADAVTIPAASGIYELVNGGANTTYVFSVYIRAASASTVKLVINTNLSDPVFQLVSVTTEWQRFSITKTTAAGTTSISSQLDTGAGVTFFLWGAQLNVATLQPYYPTTSAAYYAPRFDYNPSTGAALGLLIEESRTNSIRNNTMVGAVAGTPGTTPNFWFYGPTATGIAKSIIGTGTENGIAYIDVRFNGTATSSGTLQAGFELSNQITATVGQSWAITAYWKLVAGTTSGLSGWRIFVNEYSSTPTYLISQVVSSSAPTSSGLATQRVGGAVTTANASCAFVQPCIGVDVANGVAIDITLRIGLPQLEQGASASSVIQTTTVALTRSADVALVNTLSPWYNASEGTLCAEIGSSPVNNAVQIAYELNDNLGGGLGRVFTRRNSAGTLATAFVSGGVSQADIGPGTVIAGSAIYKVASAFKTNDFAVSANGSAAITSSSGTLPSTIARLYLGQNYGAGQMLNGYLRRITYYPRRLSDAELQSITT